MSQFLQAELVDFMHLVIVPITLGTGVSLWEGASGIEDRFHVESVTSPSGLTPISSGTRLTAPELSAGRNHRHERCSTKVR